MLIASPRMMAIIPPSIPTKKKTKNAAEAYISLIIMGNKKEKKANVDPKIEMTILLLSLFLASLIFC